MALNQLREYIARQILPVDDLGLKKQPTAGLTFPDDVPPVLSVGVVQGPQKPHLLAGDERGFQRVMRSGPVGPLNIVAPRVDVASGMVALPDLTGFAEVQFCLVATAITTTGANATIDLQAQDTQGNWFNVIAGAMSSNHPLTVLVALGAFFYNFSHQPVMRLKVTFPVGVTSLSWFVDIMGS